MTVGDILTITGGNTNFYIQGTTEDDKIMTKMRSHIIVVTVVGETLGKRKILDMR